LPGIVPIEIYNGRGPKYFTKCRDKKKITDNETKFDLFLSLAL